MYVRCREGKATRTDKRIIGKAICIEMSVCEREWEWVWVNVQCTEGCSIFDKNSERETYSSSVNLLCICILLSCSWLLSSPLITSGNLSLLNSFYTPYFFILSPRCFYFHFTHSDFYLLLFIALIVVLGDICLS